MAVMSLPMFVSNIVYALETNDVTHGVETLPKALQAQALTALASNIVLVWWVWFGRFGSVSLVG